MAGTLAATDSVFQDKTRNTSAHYGIEDGVVHQYVSEADTAFHAGNYAFNQRSIGIEHSAQPGRDASKATYQTSAALIADICNRYGLPINANTIIPHRAIVATQCPGTIDLSTLISLANNQGGSPVASSSIVDETTIRLVYNGFLMRDASADEVKVWAGKTEEAFMREVLGSAEHQQILNYWQTKGVLKPGKYTVK
jgi:N-acetylmuramoyl-L-alanine amidase CwlA